MESKNDAAKVRFFPPGIPLIAILLGVLLQFYWPIDLRSMLSAPSRFFVGGFIAFSAIAFLGLWSISLFRQGGQSENPWKPTSYIEKRGPFRITRNPMYLQMVLVCLGVGIALANGWILMLAPVVAWVLYVLAIKQEEAYLEEKFGEEYLAYKCTVRRWI